MSIETVTQILNKINDFSNYEMKVLADFERRIGFLFEHKQRVLKLINLLEKYSKVDSNAKIKIKKDILDKIRFLSYQINHHFYSLKVSTDFESLSLREKQVIGKDINNRVWEINNFKDSNAEIDKKIVKKLSKLVGIENDNLELINHFEQAVQDTKRIIESLKDNVKIELKALEKLYAMLSSSMMISYSDIHLLIDQIKGTNRIIERLLKAEKELLHDPLEQLFSKTSKDAREYRMANNIVGLSGLEMLRCVKRDVHTFTRPEEFQTYQSHLQRIMGRVPDDVLSYLSAKGHAFAKSGRKQTFMIRMIEKIAYVDLLTGLYMRRYMKTGLNSMVNLARRTGAKNITICELFLDIDNFKPFNDTYGHSEGDKALKYVAKMVMAIFRRKVDLTIRYGGEEIIVVSFETKPDVFLSLAEKLRKSIADSEDYMNKLSKRSKKPLERKNITVSIGVASKEINLQNWETEYEILHNKADRNMYKAKNSGKNKIVY